MPSTAASTGTTTVGDARTIYVRLTALLANRSSKLRDPIPPTRLLEEDLQHKADSTNNDWNVNELLWHYESCMKT